MTSEDNETKGVGIAEAAGGAAAGTAVGAGASVFSGRMKFGEESFRLFREDIDRQADTARKAEQEAVARYKTKPVAGKTLEQFVQEETRGALDQLVKADDDYVKGRRAWKEARGGLHEPAVSFAKSSHGTKTMIGATAVAGAVGTGWLINKLRNSGEKSYVKQLEAERSDPTRRERGR